MSDYRMMVEAVTSLACQKLTVAAPCSTHLETLQGETLGSLPSFARPWRPMKKFLRSHPRLREAHALAYLGAAFTRHLGRRLLGGMRLSDAREFAEHFR